MYNVCELLDNFSIEDFCAGRALEVNAVRLGFEMRRIFQKSCTAFQFTWFWTVKYFPLVLGDSIPSYYEIGFLLMPFLV